MDSSGNISNEIHQDIVLPYDVHGFAREVGFGSKKIYCILLGLLVARILFLVLKKYFADLFIFFSNPLCSLQWDTRMGPLTGVIFFEKN